MDDFDEDQDEAMNLQIREERMRMLRDGADMMDDEEGDTANLLDTT
jgi:hypothetical protein